MSNKESRVAIIDVDSILFSCFWGNKLWDPQLGDWSRDEKGRLVYIDKTEDEIGDAINTTLHTILEDTGATHYIIYVKGVNTSKHRYSVKSDYKANRPKVPPKGWEYARQFVIDTWEAVSVDNIEVDDACNIARLQIPNSFMVAVDKDLLNLEGKHYNWRKEEWVTVDKDQAEEYFWFDMIVGQPGDGIKALPGKGKAYASKLHLCSTTVLFEYIEHYGESKGIEEFYKNYTCLKILDSYEGFILTNPVEYNIGEENIIDSLFK